MSIIEILNTETHLAPSKIRKVINSKLDEIRDLTYKFIKSSDDEEREVIVRELAQANNIYTTLIGLEKDYERE